MSLEFKKVIPTKLRNVGKDEKWLQDRINEDPSILGLGDLVVIQKERSQPSGGRIDFLMYHPEEEARFEIEVMLGTLDESHIIRTIEYWDVEKRRYPNLDHRAVIVAEEITNRFFNVISLLNKSVPIIAIQLNAFTLENTLALNFVKVLDLVQEDDPEEGIREELVDRKYWNARANEAALKIMDEIIGLAQGNGSNPRVTLNKSHVALSTSGSNFLTFMPRKNPRLRWRIKAGPVGRETIKKILESAGIDSDLRGMNGIVLTISEEELNMNKTVIAEAIKIGEEFCQG